MWQSKMDWGHPFHRSLQFHQIKCHMKPMSAVVVKMLPPWNAYSIQHIPKQASSLTHSLMPLCCVSEACQSSAWFEQGVLASTNPTETLPAFSPSSRYWDKYREGSSPDIHRVDNLFFRHWDKVQIGKGSSCGLKLHQCDPWDKPKDHFSHFWLTPSEGTGSGQPQNDFESLLDAKGKYIQIWPAEEIFKVNLNYQCRCTWWLLQLVLIIC